MPIRCGAIVLSTAKAMREPDNRIKQIGSHTFFMPISKVKPLTSGTGRHNIYAMEYNPKKIVEAIDVLRETYEKNKTIKIYSIDYIGIREDGGFTPSSKFPTVFDHAKYGVVFIHYSYWRVTQEDNSFFILFLKDNELGDTIEENGWRMFFDAPITTFNVTRSRSCYIEKGNLKLTIHFKQNSTNDLLSLLTYKCLSSFIEDKIGICFQAFKAAQNCTTQQELDFLNELLNRNQEIENLNKQLFWEKLNCFYKEKAIEGYKEMLDEIKDIVETPYKK